MMRSLKKYRDDRGVVSSKGNNPRQKVRSLIGYTPVRIKTKIQKTLFVSEQVIDCATRTLAGIQIQVSVIERLHIPPCGAVRVVLPYVLRMGHLDSSLIPSKTDAVALAKAGDLDVLFPTLMSRSIASVLSAATSHIHVDIAI